MEKVCKKCKFPTYCLINEMCYDCYDNDLQDVTFIDGSIDISFKKLVERTIGINKMLEQERSSEGEMIIEFDDGETITIPISENTEKIVIKGNEYYNE